MPPLVKDIVADAIARGTSLVTIWPPSFPSIIEAEQYVSDTLEWKMFRYGFSSDAPYSVKYQVRSRTQRGIVTEAHKSGQFNLVRRPPSGAELWSVVESGIEQAQSAIEQYPKSFRHINVARAYVKTICTERGFEFGTVDGVRPQRLAMYVHYNTARRAYEAGKFTLEEKPDTPFLGKDKWKPRPSTNIGSSGSTATYSTPPTTPPNSSMAPTLPQPTIMSIARQEGAKQENCIEGENARVDSDLIDLELPLTTEENKDNVEIQLIDLFEPTGGAPDTLIDLALPKDQPARLDDLMTLIDVFTSFPSLVKDETFNELAAEIQEGQLVW